MSTINWVAALGMLLGLWFADHSKQLAAQAQADAKGFQDRAQQLEAHNEGLARELASRQILDARLGEIERNSKQLNLTLNTQTSLIQRNFTELKRNDEEVAAYLANPVPAALGLRYARPDTTDPSAYRAAGAPGVQPGGLPSAGPGTAGAN